MITAIAQTMKLSSKQEVAGLKEILLPCLMCSAVFKGGEISVYRILHAKK